LLNITTIKITNKELKNMMKDANFDGDCKEKGKETYFNQFTITNSQSALKIKLSN